MAQERNFGAIAVNYFQNEVIVGNPDQTKVNVQANQRWDMAIWNNNQIIEMYRLCQKHWAQNLEVFLTLCSVVINAEWTMLGETKENEERRAISCLC